MSLWNSVPFISHQGQTLGLLIEIVTLLEIHIPAMSVDHHTASEAVKTYHQGQEQMVTERLPAIDGNVTTEHQLLDFIHYRTEI